MILEFLNMGGYGLYIWLSYTFAALSLISLYYISVKKLNSRSIVDLASCSRAFHFT